MSIHPGLPIVISAPSGAGKTTLCKRLMELEPSAEFSISYTTRALRGAEQNGKDYHFVDDDEFTRRIEAGDFLEWAHVHSKRYGTGREVTLAKLAAGHDVLFDIDVQGGEQIAKEMPDAVLVFVLPPNRGELERRLRGRGSDNTDEINRRLNVADEEIRRARDTYRYWIVNDDLDRAVSELHAVVKAERTRQRAMKAIESYLE